MRHVRTSGYASAGLTDYSFEIDNDGRPFWVITRYERTIGFSGADTRGVLVVDALTGQINSHTVPDAPAWIDRIQPEQLVRRQLNYRGAYIHASGMHCSASGTWYRPRRACPWFTGLTAGRIGTPAYSPRARIREPIHSYWLMPEPKKRAGT